MNPLGVKGDLFARPLRVLPRCGALRLHFEAVFFRLSIGRLGGLSIVGPVRFKRLFEGQPGGGREPSFTQTYTGPARLVRCIADRNIVSA
jgi:hypothetical protein